MEGGKNCLFVCLSIRSLLLSKSLRLLHCEEKFLFQLFVALVWRQIESVETRVRPGQPILFHCLLNTELLQSIRPQQLCESPHWHPACSSHKLQQSDPLFVVYLANKLPEPTLHNITNSYRYH